MPPPTPADRLALALQAQCERTNLSLFQRQIAELSLPTGRLVACDPVVCPETPPFAPVFPVGTFPVILSVSQANTEQRVAFATVRFLSTEPTAWEMLTRAGQDTAALKPGEIFGYPVDAGIGCFMDASTAAGLVERMAAEEDYFEVLLEEMQKNYVPTWDWLDARFGRGNLVAFSAGYGDGVYASYVGRDRQGEIAAVVTDFGLAVT